jgi:hypothetical protein
LFPESFPTNLTLLSNQLPLKPPQNNAGGCSGNIACVQRTPACQVLSDIWRPIDGTFRRFSVDSLCVDKASLFTWLSNCEGLWDSFSQIRNIRGVNIRIIWCVLLKVTGENAYTAYLFELILIEFIASLALLSGNVGLNYSSGIGALAY